MRLPPAFLAAPLLAAALLALPAARPAKAAACAPRDAVLARLAQGYGERRRAIGLGPHGTVVEVFAAQATGSWTIIVTLPDGRSCPLAAGQGFETIEGPETAPGAPA